MDISYIRLRKLFVDQGMHKTQLEDAMGLKISTISKMEKNEQIPMSSMLHICITLNCDIGDTVEVRDYIAFQEEQIMDV